MNQRQHRPPTRLSPAAAQRLVGNSGPMRELKKAIAKMAPADIPVLITGETGTGKELVARCLHEGSARAHQAFVALNCPAVPPDLFQAELFGYEKGAFTGADRRNLARIDAAQGGTLFLDEIGDLPQSIQAVLLRFLQEGTFERLGSAETIRADVRIVAATHQDLHRAVAEGRFREDLFYRLNTLHIHTPPLRERGEDKLLLAEHLLRECAANLGLPTRHFSPEACQQILHHPWPGNVRELRNRILQALVLSEGRELDALDLELTGPAPDAARRCSPPRTLDDYRQQAEREAIQSALKDSGGCVKSASRRLAISRAQLYRLIRAPRISIKTL